MADLVDVPTEELVKEMQRRLNCQSKPEKHVILIGRQQSNVNGNHRLPDLLLRARIRSIKGD